MPESSVTCKIGRPNVENRPGRSIPDWGNCDQHFGEQGEDQRECTWKGVPAGVR